MAMVGCGMQWRHNFVETKVVYRIFWGGDDRLLFDHCNWRGLAMGGYQILVEGDVIKGKSKRLLRRCNFNCISWAKKVDLSLMSASST